MPESNYPSRPVKLMTGGSAGGGADPTSTQDLPPYPPTPDKLTPPPSPTGGGPGSGSGFNRRAFIKAYADMTARTWMDEQYLELLLASPVETLEKAGIHTIPGAVIRIIQHKITGSGKIEDQVNAWIEGNRTGLYELYLPLRPDDIDLSEEGGMVSLDGNCCTCSPCCCCT